MGAGEMMNFEKAKMVRVGDRIACRDQSWGMKIATVEKVLEWQWRKIDFLIQDRKGRSCIISMDDCNPA
jgi:hypothetical protein